jgi:excisionase family DNA binding protein
MSSTLPPELTTHDAAKLLGCHPETLRRWVRAGRIQVVDHPMRPGQPRGYRFLRDDILRIYARGVAA